MASASLFFLASFCLLVVVGGGGARGGRGGRREEGLLGGGGAALSEMDVEDVAAVAVADSETGAAAAGRVVVVYCRTAVIRSLWPRVHADDGLALAYPPIEVVGGHLVEAVVAVLVLSLALGPVLGLGLVGRCCLGAPLL